MKEGIQKPLRAHWTERKSHNLHPPGAYALWLPKNLKSWIAISYCETKTLYYKTSPEARRLEIILSVTAVGFMNLFCFQCGVCMGRRSLLRLALHWDLFRCFCIILWCRDCYIVFPAKFIRRHTIQNSFWSALVIFAGRSDEYPWIALTRAQTIETKGLKQKRIGSTLFNYRI